MWRFLGFAGISQSRLVAIISRYRKDWSCFTVFRFLQDGSFTYVVAQNKLQKFVEETLVATKHFHVFRFGQIENVVSTTKMFP